MLSLRREDPLEGGRSGASKFRFPDTTELVRFERRLDRDCSFIGEFIWGWFDAAVDGLLTYVPMERDVRCGKPPAEAFRFSQRFELVLFC